MNDVREFIRRRREDLTWIGPGQLDIRFIIHRKSIRSNGIELQSTCAFFQDDVHSLIAEEMDIL